MTTEKQQTPLHKLTSKNDELRHAMQIIQNFIEGDYQDQASLKEAWNLISDYVTLSESLLPEEKQMVIDAHDDGWYDKEYGTRSSEQYFNETFNQIKDGTNKTEQQLP